MELQQKMDSPAPQQSLANALVGNESASGRRQSKTDIAVVDANVKAEEGPICCIAYADFHPLKGPRLVLKDPQDTQYFDENDFNSISDYIITKPQLSNRLIVIEALQGKKIMGYPVSIEHKKYPRNALMFNCFLVFKDDCFIASFEPVAEKLARFLTSLEKNHERLSQLHANENETQLKALLARVRSELNEWLVCSIPSVLGDAIHLKLNAILPAPRCIRSFEVPILVRKLDSEMLDRWDITLRRILPHIDGVKHVTLIAKISDVHIDLVTKCLERLAYFRFIALIDILQYSNIYAVAKDGFQTLINNDALVRQCIGYSRRSMQALPALPSQVIRLYSQFQYNNSVRVVCEENNIGELNINIRKFIQFGVVKSILRRVHMYPVRLPLSKGDEVDNSILDLVPFLNGLHCMDKICDLKKKSYKELEEELANDRQSIILRKIWNMPMF
eukprot:Nk52_evm10s224 gene=Nk52_evmTU10s224